MATRIMVYGDSNSWGLRDDGSDQRFEPYWPKVMAQSLNIEVIEEALPGRTTVHDDPEMMGTVMNGLAHLPVALKSHVPLDAVILLLGTNDLKRRFDPSAKTIAKNLQRLIECIRAVGGAGPAWGDPAVPQIFVVSPPPLGALADDPDWQRSAEWRGARDISLQLADAIAEMAAAQDVAFFDAGTAVRGSEIDPIHWVQSDHLALGVALADWIQDQLN